MGNLRICKLSRPFKLTILLTSWSVSLILLFILSTNSAFKTPYKETGIYGSELRLPRNQIGSLSYIRRDPKQNGRPIYAVAFDNLILENNKLGFFRTALHKVAKIRDLKLSFYHYDPIETKVNPKPKQSNARETIPAAICKREKFVKPHIPFAPKTQPPDTKELLKKVVHTLRCLEDGWHIDNIDFTNVSEVRVDDFEYKIFHENDLLLTVRCKRAITSYRNSNIYLRGNVRINYRNNTTLQSNCIEWDAANTIFKVKGVYALSRTGTITTGKNACFDFELNEVTSQRIVKGEG